MFVSVVCLSDSTKLIVSHLELGTACMVHLVGGAKMFTSACRTSLAMHAALQTSTSDNVQLHSLVVNHYDPVSNCA